VCAARKHSQVLGGARERGECGEGGRSRRAEVAFVLVVAPLELLSLPLPPLSTPLLRTTCSCCSQLVCALAACTGPARAGGLANAAVPSSGRRRALHAVVAASCTRLLRLLALDVGFLELRSTDVCALAPVDRLAAPHGLEGVRARPVQLHSLTSESMQRSVLRRRPGRISKLEGSPRASVEAPRSKTSERKRLDLSLRRSFAALHSSAGLSRRLLDVGPFIPDLSK